MSEFIAQLKRKESEMSLKSKSGKKKKEKHDEENLSGDSDIGTFVEDETGFRWGNIQYHLTYKTHIPFDIVLNKIREVFKPVGLTSYSLVHETSDKNHGYDHTHVYFYLSGRRQLRGSRLMDIGEIHPHIQKVLVSVHAKNIFKYHLKAPVGEVLQYGLSEIPDEGLKTVKKWDDIRDRLKAGDLGSICMDYPAEYIRCRSALIAEHNESVVLEPLKGLANLWFYGPPNTGKSTFARKRLIEVYGTYYVYNKGKWWDGYNGEKAVLIEELAPDDVKGRCSFYKTLFDLYPIRVEKKGSSLQIRPECFVVTTNFTIMEVFGVVDFEAMNSRFVERHFTQKYVVEKPKENKIVEQFLL